MRIAALVVVAIVGAGCGYSGSDGCSGEIVGEYCWYLGEDYDSCEDTCADRGGVTDGTIYFAGSEGSQENCTLVAAAFGKPASVTRVEPKPTVPDGMEQERARFRQTTEAMRYGYATVDGPLVFHFNLENRVYAITYLGKPVSPPA